MKTWTRQCMMPITKNYSGFQFQATSSDLEDITHLHTFCDSLYFYLSCPLTRRKKTSPQLPLGLSCPIRAVPWLQNSFQGQGCCRGSVVMGNQQMQSSLSYLSAWPLALGIYLYPLSCLQTPLSRRTSSGQIQGWDPYCPEAHYCFFVPSCTSSHSGRCFFLAWGMKLVVFCPVDIQGSAYTGKSFLPFISSANYS